MCIRIRADLCRSALIFFDKRKPQAMPVVMICLLLMLEKMNLAEYNTNMTYKSPKMVR